MTSIIIRQCLAKNRKGTQCSRKGPYDGYCNQHKLKILVVDGLGAVIKKRRKRIAPYVYPGSFQVLPSDIMHMVLSTLDCNGICYLNRTCVTYRRLCYRLRPTMLFKQPHYSTTILHKAFCSQKRSVQKSLANDVFTCPVPTHGSWDIVKQRVHKYIKYTIENDIYLFTDCTTDDDVSGDVCRTQFVVNIYHLFPVVVLDEEGYLGYFNSRRTQYLLGYCETIRKSSNFSVPIDLVFGVLL
jgi:hypothetical protein